jgi:4-alpha-glucanotransferase
MNPLHALAAAIGVERTWRDAEGRDQIVADEPLAAILGALGYPAYGDRAIRASLRQRAEERLAPPVFLSADIGVQLSLPSSLSQAVQAELALEGGGVRLLPIERGVLPAITELGYHRLVVAGREITLAVAPPACPSPAGLVGGKRLWGPAGQIPSLRGDAPRAYGDLADLAGAVSLFAARGADAVAVSPLHALLPGRGERFSPYAPSSRLFLNGALADPALAGCPIVPPSEASALIDWPAALPQRLATLRRCFAAAPADLRRQALDWAERQGPALARHALFDALAVHHHDNGPGWRYWPREYRRPDSPAVARFASEQAEELEFHIFIQWLADRSLEAVQMAAEAKDMAIGLITDLAVGIDPCGSDGWAMRDALLSGLTIGAPPDPLGPDGQNWGLTSFSPNGLIATGFTPWIATLRSALRHARGVRIDHAFGLARLWVVPEGGRAMDGAYLSYPFTNLLRLVALEAHRAGAIVVGEDLGTRPPGFAEAAADKGILGMHVLWFERAADGCFASPGAFAPSAVAMTGTHDTATIAGWWCGRDIDWNRRLGRGSDWTEAEKARETDRTLLWSAIGGGTPEPPADAPQAVVDAVVTHIAQVGSDLVIVPLEDLLALEEQPNLPGTIDEHPNWRRRLPGPLARLLDEPATARRTARLAEGRRA